MSILGAAFIRIVSINPSLVKPVACTTNSSNKKPAQKSWLSFNLLSGRLIFEELTVEHVHMGSTP